jgi:hypothetical protein
MGMRRLTGVPRRLVAAKLANAETEVCQNEDWVFSAMTWQFK